MRSRVPLILLPVAMLLSGCATAMATLPQGPDIYSFAPRSDAATVVVARPADARADKKRLGSISALRLKMDADPSQFLGNELVAALYEQQVNGVMGRVSSIDSPESFAQAATEHGAQGVLAVTIESISVESFDALMDPPTAKVTLGGILYDSQGNVVERDSVTGQVQRRINTFAAERSTGQLVGEALHDAAQRLVSREPLASAITELATTQPVAATETGASDSEAVSARDADMETAVGTVAEGPSKPLNE